MDQLRAILGSLAQSRKQILVDWHLLYTLHLMDKRTLSEPEFTEIFGNELELTARDLLRKDFDAPFRGSSGGNQAQAAKILGISRKKLYTKKQSTTSNSLESVFDPGWSIRSGIAVRILKD